MHKGAYGIWLMIVLLMLFFTKESASGPSEKQGGYAIGYPAEVAVKTDAVRYTGSIANTTRQVQYEKVVSEEAAMIADVKWEDPAVHNTVNQIEQLRKVVEQKDRKIDVLTQRLARVTKKLEQKESEFFMMQPERPQIYEVRKGDNLWRIASKKNIYGNGYMWIKIYNANMSKISNPNIVYPGQLFEIPK